MKRTFAPSPARGNGGLLRRPSRWLPRLLLVALLLIAAGLRLWRLPDLPPGLYADEAINGVDVRMVLGGHGLPAYFSANNGREPLFIYLQALSVAALGATPLALRLVSALAGIAAVAAVYFCASLLLADRSPDGDASPSAPWPALLAAAGAAVSYWALSLSRIGLRAGLLVPLSALALGFFWRAWRDGRRRDYVLAGVWLALSLYTYTAARLLPMVLLAFVAIEALAALLRSLRPRSFDLGGALRAARPRLVGLCLLAGIAALLLAPLAAAIWRDPAALWGRAGQVSVLAPAGPNDPGGLAPAAGRLARNVGLVLRSFYDQGDRNPRHNLPGRPVDDPLLAALFTLGWLAALWRLREPRYRLLLLWFAAMLLPTALSAEAPHSLRAAGALPPLCLLYGAGGQALARIIPAGNARRAAGPVALAALVLVSGGLTARDYFGRWARLPALATSFNVQPQLAAQATAGLLAQGGPKEPVLVSRRLYMHPHMTFAVGLPEQVAWPAWLDAQNGRAAAVRFVLEPSVDPAEPLYLLWREGGRTQVAPVEPLGEAGVAALAGAQGPDAAVVRAAMAPESWPQVQTGLVPANVALAPRTISVPLDVTFADGIRLAGYSISPDVLPADHKPAEFRLSLFWEIGRHAERGVVMPDGFVNFATPQGVRQTTNGSLPESYLMTWLREPRLVEDIRIIPVPAGTPAEKALFEIGLFLPADQSTAGHEERIDIVDGAGRAVADRVDLGPVMVGRQPPDAGMAGLEPLGARFEDAIELAGWRAVEDSGSLEVELGWRALARVPAGYTAFVHLIDADGKILAQYDVPPGGAEDPTSHWVPGETVRTRVRLQPAAGTRLADARLRIGLYEPVSGRQLPVRLPDGSAAGTFVILPAGG